MWYKTHAAAGAAAALCYMRFSPPATPKEAAVFLGVAVFSAIAVDIDSAESKIGRILFPISVPLERTLGHRGPIHSPFVAMGVYILLSLVQSDLAVPVLLGWMFGHLLPDALNPAGLSLWPFKGRISLPLITPLGIIDRIIFISLIVLCVYIAAPQFFGTIASLASSAKEVI